MKMKPGVVASQVSFSVFWVDFIIPENMQFKRQLTGKVISAYV